MVLFRGRFLFLFCFVFVFCVGWGTAFRSRGFQSFIKAVVAGGEGGMAAVGRVGISLAVRSMDAHGKLCMHGDGAGHQGRARESAMFPVECMPVAAFLARV